ncbi:M3 family metallopeptidase [Flavobacterium sp. Fl-318]|uniref:oligopeptidase A n=1 Tax=Flavobacterium cupriresistens TaxID=2893885 RepID=A0ABU4RG79_9FLAO|nr:MULTISPECIES: M3 family metallopeptidase [unclassified Flavobacterium]MDX6190689.1 M3 family metallopeptidase [Flavobacterium sp. Fl-318]UFH44134.1 M3 family metallopeptidase [Flavobacterium sp. F-323]
MITKKIIGIILMGTTFFASNAQTNTENPLLKKWTGPYGGVPAFNLYKVSDFKPALQFAIQEKLDEVDAIANNSKAPTFDNTIAALERSGKTITRISTVYGIYRSNISSPEFNVVDTEMSPKFSEFSDKINQNKKLFERIEDLYNSKESKKLTSEQQRLIWLYYTDFVREGAKLNNADKEKVAKINKELATLFTRFNQNLLAEENNQYVALKTEADFDGLPAEEKNAAIAEAKERKLDVMGCVANTRSSIEPFLTFSTRRDLREKAFDIFVKRGDNGNENDTNSTLVEILKLRTEKAKILGFPSFAHWSLSNKMAKDPQKTLDLMMSVWKPAVEKVQQDVAEMQKIVDTEGGKFKIEPWDYRYYAEKVRKAKYDLDQNEVKPYLQLENLREGMFWVAGELFNLKFKQITDVPVYHPDVRVWEVSNKITGKVVGLWYFDPYARSGKRSGAWMNSYRDQQKLDGDILTIVSNNCNFIKGTANEPVLISWSDATTLFHEFGHALHGLCSNVTYPSLSGTSVARDYVEFPSQLLEHWLATPEVLNKFALHYKTNEPLPQALVDRIEKAADFGEGFATVETISSSLIDMKLHLATEAIDPHKFEKETLDALNMPSEIVMRHRIPQFGHIFSSDGYAAGYYSYLWADVINADAYEAFLEGKGPYDKEVAKRLYDNVFSTGNTIDQEKAYENFRGRAPKSDALMRARNFPITDKK